MNRQRLVVIGNGMAGARLVEEVVRRDLDGRLDVTIFGDEPYGNYNRILLSGVLAGTHRAQDVFINPLEWDAAHGVTLHAGAPVTRIDREARRLYAGGDLAVSYDDLVMATGSVPFIPPIEGLRTTAGGLTPGVHVFRTLDDCHRIVWQAERSRRAVVIGGGLLGLEAARGLLALGLEVHVVHLMPHLMDLQLDRAAGRVLERTLQQLGVHLHLEKATTKAIGGESIEGLAFSDGTTLACDLVVVAAGIRPHTALATQAGLVVNRGIVVGDDLATSDPHIYAVGECAEHRGQTYGLVAPLWEQARVLAERLAGTRPDARYEGSRVSTKLKVMEVDLAVMGERDGDPERDEVVTYAEPTRGVYKKLIVRDGRLAGAIVLGAGSIAPALLQAFDRGTELPEDRSALLFPRTAGASEGLGVQGLSADAQVCNCNGVSKQQIVAAVAGGCRTLKAVCSATRAATGCGSCATLVQAIVEGAAGGDLDEDPAAHYYVPGVPLNKP